MPVIIAACSRGNEYEAAFKATIWNPPAMNVDQDIIAIVIAIERVPLVAPRTSANAVRMIKSPAGRLLS